MQQAAQAVRRENYRGVIAYLRSDDVETLKIVHRYHKDREEERLVSLSGQDREIIRKGDKVTSILPEQKVVLISEHPAKGLLGNVSDFSTSRLKGNYAVQGKGKARVAGRTVRIVLIKPCDEYRYGYRMFVDTRTALPLKLELIDHDKRLEQMMFTAIAFPDEFDEDDFATDYDVHDYRVVRHQSIDVDDQEKEEPDDKQWSASDLPSGFELAQEGVRQLTQDASVHQMLFTDGVATVSAFVAPAGLRAPLRGATRMGAINAYGDIVDDTQITVVGEVPAATARRIAKGLIKKQKKMAHD